MSTERSTVYLPLSELKPDPRNPKSHQLDVIDESYDRHGVIDSITRDDRTGFIISGHGRAQTLKDRFAKGESAPEGVRVDPTTGEWLVPVTTGWASKDDVQATSALLILNRSTELGGWVDDALLDALDRLAESGENGFTGSGFELTDLDDLRVQLEEQATFDNEAAAARVRAAAETGDPDGNGDELDEHGNPIHPDGISGGAGANPSAPGNTDLYSEQGRRLVVLDYSVDEFAAVAPRIKLLRVKYGVDSNAEAVRLHMLELYPTIEDPAAVAEALAAPADDYAEVDVSQSTKGDEPGLAGGPPTAAPTPALGDVKSAAADEVRASA